MGLIAFIFFSLLFSSATILSGPYLWNRYSQRLQIECAAWSCGLILHCCLPSNSLRYFLFLFFFVFCFFRHDFVRAISLEPLLAETPNWVCCLVLQFNFALLLTIQFASLISSLINIINLLVTSFNSAVTLKLKCGKVVCVEFFISRDHSSVAYRAIENLSRYSFTFSLFLLWDECYRNCTWDDRGRYMANAPSLLYKYFIFIKKT